jgi:hypothetical protein
MTMFMLNGLRRKSFSLFLEIWLKSLTAKFAKEMQNKRKEKNRLISM